MRTLIIGAVFYGLLIVGLISGLSTVQPIGVLAYACLHIPALIMVGYGLRSTMRRYRLVTVEDRRR